MNSLRLFSLHFKNFVSKKERIGFTFTVVIFSLLILLLTVGTPFASAEDDNDGDEIPFDVVNIFFELNNTDGDLGIHTLIDGEPWRKLVIEDTNERRILVIRNRGRLARQGLTELFFESAEPTFDELDPEDFFNRFPEGIYEVEGLTIDRQELEGEAEVTHLIPAPPNVFVSGEATPEDCDSDEMPAVSDQPVISWDPVTTSHPELGSPKNSSDITIIGYQVVVEREEGIPLTLTFDLAPDETMVELPAGLFSSEDELKLEVLVRESSGNQTANETCFEIE